MTCKSRFESKGGDRVFGHYGIQDINPTFDEDYKQLHSFKKGKSYFRFPGKLITHPESEAEDQQRVKLFQI